MRAELSRLVQGLIPTESRPMPTLAGEDTERLDALATRAARARSTVERNGYNREIEMIVGEEAPGRLATMLGGMAAIGVPAHVVWHPRGPLGPSPGGIGCL